MNTDLSWVLTEARAALDSQGLHDWDVTFDHARRRAGRCHHTYHKLSFSRTLLALYPKDAIRDIIAHEVAHALAGAEHHHDEVWKAIARRLGARPETHLPSSLPSPPAPWVGTCPRCGTRRELFATPRRVASCGACSPRFDVNLIWQWTHFGQPCVPPGRYREELESLTGRKEIETLTYRAGVETLTYRAQSATPTRRTLFD